MPTEMELTLEQTQQGVSYEVSNIRVISFTMKMEILLEPTSNKLMVDPHGFEGIYKEGHGVKEFQRSFRHSDTERLSRSDEVLKLKNFMKDAAIKLFQINKSRKVRACQSRSHKFTRWQSLQDGETRLCLVDDLKITFSHSRQDKGTSSSLKSMITTSIHKLKTTSSRLKLKALYARIKSL
ncbi:hypothetical protein Tco_0568552 [Tanacetum coccineum]